MSLFLGIITTLAIVLPIALCKNEDSYFAPDDFVKVFVDKEQLLNEMDKAGCDILNLSDYEIGSCILLTVNGEVKGGSATIESDSYNLIVRFYDKFVCGDMDTSLYNNKYKISNIEILYETRTDGELFYTDAFIEYKNIYLTLEYLSLKDDSTEIFDELFV